MIESSIIDPLQLAAIQKGRAYGIMEASEGYRLLLDYLEKKTSLALKAVSDCEDGNDRKKLDLMLAWRETGRLFDDIQREVQRGIEDGKEALKNLQIESPEEATVFGFGSENFDE